LDDRKAERLNSDLAGRPPVTEDYETRQGHFTGEISWVRIDIGNETFSDPSGLEEALAGGLSHACHSEITGFNS
jgi:hypothetical protein